MEKRLLTVRDVMQLLKISRRTIYYWIKDELLKPVKIGHSYRFYAEDIENLVQSAARAKSFQTSSAKRILAVDDDLLVRESLKPLLSRAGYEVTVVPSGEQAIKEVEAKPFHMILTDIRMPQMNGLELLKKIRNLLLAKNLPQIPEMVFTAFYDKSAITNAKRLGVREFMMKPFELSDFLAAIKRCLGE